MKRSLFAELKRRNVIRVAIAYVAVSWLVLQAGALMFQAFDLPNTLLRGLVALLVVGFIPTLVFSWVYELTPEGLKRESEVDRDESITHLTGRKLDYLVIGVLGAIVALLLVDKFVLAPRLAARAVANAPAATQSASEPAVEQASIAVLPFVNMSSDKEQDYFSDGMSEELLNLLAKIPQLHVAARTSSFAFKGKQVEIPDIARQLHVAHVLEGSIRKAGDQIRITAQLIHAADGYHVWSQTWDRKLDDIFKIQDEIAGDVVKDLKVSLLGEAPKARTTDPQAYAMYLQAVQLGRQVKGDAFAKSDALYHQVLAIDPGYAPAWFGLSRNLSNEAGAGVISNQEAHARAREAAEKAIAIDPDYAPAYSGLGFISMTFENDLAGAARQLERALVLAPTNLDVLGNSGTLLRNLGRLKESLVIEEARARRDPVNPAAFHNLAFVQVNFGQLDAAMQSARTSLNLSPDRGQSHYFLAIVFLFKGEASAALAEMQQETIESWRMFGLPMAYHSLGRKAESDQALAQLIAKYEKDSAYNIAYVYAFRGEADKAFEWLDKAIVYEDPGLSEIPYEKLFDNIRKDPRWLPFLRKIGKAPEQLAKIQFKVTLPKEWQAEADSTAGKASAAAASLP